MLINRVLVFDNDECVRRRSTLAVVHRLINLRPQQRLACNERRVAARVSIAALARTHCLPALPPPAPLLSAERKPVPGESPLPPARNPSPPSSSVLPRHYQTRSDARRARSLVGAHQSATHVDEAHRSCIANEVDRRRASLRAEERTDARTHGRTDGVYAYVYACAAASLSGVAAMQRDGTG